MRRRAEQAARQLPLEIEEELKARLAEAGLRERCAALEEEVTAGRLTPRAAAKALVFELTRPAKRRSR